MNLADSSATDKRSYNPDAFQADAVNSVPPPKIQRPTFTNDTRILDDAIPPVQEKLPNRGKQRFFGISKTKVQSTYPNLDDYELKYPEDARGEELGPSARVWRTYLDEAQKADEELVEGWRDTTDVLLVFAGLFSAVVATFVVQTSDALETDYTQVTASLLFETNALLRAAANNLSLSSIPPSPLTPNSNASASTNDKWVNGLWFASLSVSLVAAFMAVLVKQWMQHYQSVVFGNIQDQVRIRQYRYLGVERWHIPLIIGTLPMLLHLALLLYFAGLILFLVPLDAPIAYTTTTIASLAYIFYFLSNALPLWYPMCPYKTPLSSLMAWSISNMHILFSIVIQWCRSALRLPPAYQRSIPSERPGGSHLSGHRVLHRMKGAEKDAVRRVADELDAEALVWLYSTSSNPTVTTVTVQAVSGLRFDFPAAARDILRKVITFKEGTVEHILMQQGQIQSNLPKLERMLRACHQLQVTMPMDSWKQSREILATASADDPLFKTLHACHSMLYNHPVQRHRQDEHPTSVLEHYNNYATEGLQEQAMWTVLLRRGQLHLFWTPLECWAHAFRVLHGFLLNCPISNPHGELRFAMVLEYFCSLSVRDGPNHSRLAAPSALWGDDSVLNGATFNFARVLPHIYAALAATIDAQHKKYASQPSAVDLRTLRNLQVSQELVYWHIFRSGALPAVDAIAINPEDKTSIMNAASVLRSEIQWLVESDIFKSNKMLSESRDRYCQLLFCPDYWPASSRISWTPALMEWFLQCNIRVRYRWVFLNKSQLYSYFYEGNPEMYRLFVEKDGLSREVRYQHGDEFLQSYLHGLLQWKGTPAELGEQLDYLFTPVNLTRVVQEFILLQNDDGSSPHTSDSASMDSTTDRSYKNVARLFKLRSPDTYPEGYGEHLDCLRSLIEGLSEQDLLPPSPVSSTGTTGLHDRREKPVSWIRRMTRTRRRVEAATSIV